MCTCQDWKVLQCVIKDAQNCCSQYISISILPQAVRLPNSLLTRHCDNGKEDFYYNPILPQF